MRRLLWLLAVCAMACGPADGGGMVVDSGRALVCEPGRAVTCPCAGGTSGVQTCTADGTGYGACSMCPAPMIDAGTPVDVPAVADVGSRVCDPGRTVTCACAGGATGAQTCSRDGTGYEPCACAAPDAGPADVPAADPCAAGNSCGSCTPLTGCGWCGATARCQRITSCSATEASACGASWACFPSDCPGSTDCRPCSTNADCPSGMCLLRGCDGAHVCAPQGRAAICATINGGSPCPLVPAYRRCSSTAQCGPAAACVAVYPGDTATVCARTCTTDADCPPVLGGGNGIPYCARTEGRCYLGCNAAGTCTADGLTCRRSTATGNYAYCL